MSEATAMGSPRRFRSLLADVETTEKLTAESVGRVLSRMLIAAPSPVSQADIARGAMLARRTELGAATVSRAVAYLHNKGLVSKLEGDKARSAEGRAFTPVRLGTDQWAVVGVDVFLRGSTFIGLDGQLMELDLTPLGEPVERDFSQDPIAPEQLAHAVEDLVRTLKTSSAARGRDILGVGVSVGGHIDLAGRIVEARGRSNARITDFGPHLSAALELPVIVENDVNVRALRLAYAPDFPERDFAVVAVFDEGVGGALVIDGRLYRGASGIAGEVGHVTVEHPAELSDRPDDADGEASSRDQARPAFSDACLCGQYGHTDALATPARIAAELDVTDIREAAFDDVLDDRDRLTSSARVFRRAGIALGRALAAFATLNNPARLVLILPPDLAQAPAGTAASAYLAGTESIFNTAFSTASADARAGQSRLTIYPLATADVPADGAHAAGYAVMHALINEATNRVARVSI